MNTEQKNNKSGSQKLEEWFGQLTISQLLLAHRESLNLSQTAMAKKLNLSNQKLCDFEKGRRLPSPQMAEHWALVLQVSSLVWIEAVLKEQINKCKTVKIVKVA